MAHIAIVNGGLRGRINSSLEMAARLQSEGHEVTFLTQPYTIDFISQKGFECQPLPTIGFTYEDPRLEGSQASWFLRCKLHLKYLGKHYEHGKKILNLDRHKSVLRQLSPDLILIDVEVHDLVFTAYELKIPICLFTTWFSDKIGLTSPSVRKDIVPGEGFWGSKIGIGLSWLVIRSKVYARVVVNRLNFHHYRRYVLRKYAKEIGFDLHELQVNTLPPLYSFLKLPILSMTMTELDFPHKLAENFKYVGPMVWEKRIDKISTSAESLDLESILRGITNSKKYLVYCSVGSLAKGNLLFIKNVIEAVSNEEDKHLILSIGPKMEKKDFQNLPSNVHVFNWVSQLKVLENADCCITHCGINSINECIHSRVPMLLYSGKYTDENGNAARTAFHGLGIKGDISKDDSSIIRENIQQVLTNEVFKVNLNTYHEIYLNYKNRPLSPMLFDLE